MSQPKHLAFPFDCRCLLQIENQEQKEQLTCELAVSIIEIFQSLNYRNVEDFSTPLVLKFDSPNIQSYVLSTYGFPVEHICVNEKALVDKFYVQPTSKLKTPFIQAYSSLDFVILAPVGFIDKYILVENETIMKIIPTDLLEAYNSTDFIVYDKNIVIKIGESNKELDKLLEEHNASSWSFITAYNPLSNVLPDEENNSRHHELMEHTNEYAVFDGEGKGQNSEWKPEKSLLIVGISKNEAYKIGKHFKQYAIVVGEYRHKAELLLT